MDELTKKANEVKSRFSISSYYHSQVKDPTPEMLKQINAEIDPETGNVVKKKRVKKEAKTTEKKEKKAKGEESDAMIEMELESDNEEEIELESDDDDDDVIRDNKAAIAARKKEAEKKSESGETKTAAETKEVAEAKPKRAPRKRAAKDAEEKPKRAAKDAEEKPKRAAKDAEEKPKRAAKDAEEKAKKEVEPKPDEKEIIPVEDSDSDDDHYVPLSERLKRKMDGDKRSSIVDDLINTKSTVPVSRKRKSPAAKSDTAAKKRKAKDESSDDSLFGF